MSGTVEVMSGKPSQPGSTSTTSVSGHVRALPLLPAAVVVGGRTALPSNASPAAGQRQSTV